MNAGPERVVLLSTPDRGHEVSSIYAVVAIDPQGNEGICGSVGAMGPMPWVFSKLETIDRMRPQIELLKRASKPGTRIVLRKFADVMDIETL